MSNFDAIKLAVESSMPNNTVLFDDKGMPSVMVKIPKFKMKDVITGGSDTVHPAFIVNGVEKDCIYISKYQNIVVDDRAYSLAFKDPETLVDFDQAKQYCENKGEGWHLMTNAEWAAIALWCLKNGSQPNGNNNYGTSYVAPHESGIASSLSTDGTKTNRTATGSGPVTWSHNGDSSGIYDLNGNVFEWVGGYRTVNGEIQIIPNNNAAITGLDQSETSKEWKGINKSGTLVNPGTTNTLKYDTSAKLVEKITGTPGTTGVTFKSVTKDSAITTVPEMLKALALYPSDGTLEEGYFYVDNREERLARRGGTWTNTSYAGVFYLFGSSSRSYSYSSIGFRAAFVE